MKHLRIITLLAITCFLFVFTQSVFARKSTKKKPNNIRKQIVTLVNHSAARIRDVGRIKAACEFNARNTKMGSSKPYIFAYVCNDNKNNGFILVSGNLDLIYTNQYNTPNQAIFRDALHENPNGTWVTYQSKNPANGKIEQKKSYIMELGQHKVCIGMGYYTK